MLVFVLAFAVIGYLIYSAFATAPIVATLQGEQMTPSGVSTTASSSGFMTSLTNNSTITTPYLWTFDPGVPSTAGYFWANGKLLKKVTGPGPYVLRINSGMLKGGTSHLGHAWDTASGQHQTPPSSYSVKVNNISGSGFVTTLKSDMTINAPYIWAFDPGTATTAGYFWADGSLLTSRNGAGPYAMMMGSSTLTAGSHTLGHAWDTTTGSHKTPPSGYNVTYNPDSTSSNYSVVNDASASGGKAAKFGGGVKITGTVNLSAAGTSLTVTARADACGSRWPQMAVAVDGKSYINTAVQSTTWNGYSANASLASGSHTLSITNTGGSGCYLYVDVTNFYGAAPSPTPAPTVALSVSPTSLTAGQSSTLTWTSTNATSCTAAGAWSGTEPTAGSLSTGALNQNSTYSLTCTGSGGSASASATVTVTAVSSNQNYDQAISYTQTRAPFTPTRTIDVSDAAGFNNAIANLQPGDLVKATGGFTVNGETIISNRLSAPAVIDLSAYPVDFVYSGGQNLPAVWLNNASNIRIYGGDLSTSDSGGGCLLSYGGQSVTWWGFTAHDCGGAGAFITNVGGPTQNNDFQGTIWSVGHNLSWDPHAEKGSGLHAVLLWDSDNSNAFTNNRFAFYAHDIPVGNCVEAGNGAAAPATGNVLYLKCVNETFVSTVQTGGNGLELWGSTSSLGLDVKYIEVDNAQGRAVDAEGLSSGQSLSGVTVEYGTASQTNQNSRLDGGRLPGYRWDTLGNINYQSVSPKP